MTRFALFVLLVVGLSSCARPIEHKYKLYVFGTLVEFILYDVDKEKADQEIAVISTRFQAMHRDWHAWKPGQLTQLNKAFREGRSLEQPGLLANQLKEAKRFEKMSGGLFNPAIGGLIALWGFHADEKPSGPPPDKMAIKALVEARPSMRDVILEDKKLVGQIKVEGGVGLSGWRPKKPLTLPDTRTVISSKNPNVQLDFGGFAKGSALDWAAIYLKTHGIKNAILNAGGDLNVIGRHGARPWKVGIRHPKHWGVIASVDLGPDEVLYTSGNYHRFLEHEGLRYSHIIDPRTGWPVDHIVSASVIHTSGALADAAATALSVAGPKAWRKTAKGMGVDQVLLVDKDGALYMTPKMHARLKLRTAEKPRIRIETP